MLWALVDPSKPNQNIMLRCAGTGHDIEDEKLNYINTIFVDNLVFHFFEVGDSS